MILNTYNDFLSEPHCSILQEPISSTARLLGMVKFGNKWPFPFQRSNLVNICFYFGCPIVMVLMSTALCSLCFFVSQMQYIMF